MSILPLFSFILRNMLCVELYYLFFLFNLAASTPGWQKVMDSIDVALELGYNPVKVTCKNLMNSFLFLK